METVTVKASREYDVLIGRGLLKSLGERVGRLVKGRSCVVVSDDITGPLFGEMAENSLKKSGFDVHRFTIAHGESSKNGQNFLELLEFAAESGLCRDDVFIALGGGVVGDLTGFAAASFERGVSFVQVPTTILAAVDSSVGGKTAIDLKAGKNLAGAFLQPVLVLCDTDTLDTLDDERFADGCGEIIKHTYLIKNCELAKSELKIYLRSLYDSRKRLKKDTDLGQGGWPEYASILDENYKLTLELIIAENVRIKASFVHADECDRSLRAFLNLGHTVGHGIELLSGYTVTHGHAVATGIAYAARVSLKKRLINESCCNVILGDLADLGFETESVYGAKELAEAAMKDKKRSGDEITLVLPVSDKECVLEKVQVSELSGLLG